jgi:hypothetical protein
MELAGEQRNLIHVKAWTDLETGSLKQEFKHFSEYITIIMLFVCRLCNLGKFYFADGIENSIHLPARLATDG